MFPTMQEIAVLDECIRVYFTKDLGIGQGRLGRSAFFVWQRGSHFMGHVLIVPISSARTTLNSILDSNDRAKKNLKIT